MLDYSIQDFQGFVKSGFLNLPPTTPVRGSALSIGPITAIVVELRGLEPLTPSVQRRCSPKLSYSPLPSTLSYHHSHRSSRLQRRSGWPQHPRSSAHLGHLADLVVCGISRTRSRPDAVGVLQNAGPRSHRTGATAEGVGHSGLEPETSPLSEECSSQLS
jgi:hypothetical protein